MLDGLRQSILMRAKGKDQGEKEEENDSVILEIGEGLDARTSTFIL